MDSTEINKITYGIGQLAEEFGISSRAIRLYEEEGLLNPRREGTRRIYNDRNRVRLRLILRGKRLGWSLAEIRESFDLYDSGLGEKAQLESMHEKLEKRRAALIEQKADIDNALEDLERIESGVLEALDRIRSGQRKARHG
jgi:DNA-binding transcriptional MerR regulator